MFSAFTDWYLWYYIFLAFMGIVYVQQKNKFLASDEGHKLESESSYRVSIVFALLTFLPIIIITGFRDRWYADTAAYAEMFESWPSSLGEALGNIDWNGKFPGFIVFSVIIKQFFGSDYQIWLIIIAIISGLCVALTYRRYTPDVVTCAFLFFASADYQSWMMNGMRQFVAAAVLFAAFPLVQKKKYVLFISLVLIMFTFHRSAIIVLPLYFLALGKPFNKKTMIILLLCIFACFFVKDFLGLMDDSLQSTSYNNLVSEFQDDGTNPMRVLVYGIPTLLAFINRKKLDESTPEIINISINMSIISLGLFILSIFTSGIFMGRLPIFFSLFNYILLPWELKNFYNEDMHKSLFIAMIALYIVYYFISMSGIVPVNYTVNYKFD